MWPIIIIVLVLLAAAIAFALLRKRKPSNFAGAETYRNLMGMQQPATASTAAAEALRQNLRVKYLYQEDKIDAAIAYERERNPTGTAEQLMQSAIARWERDNA